jgi:GT2 family glycosyltransferase
LINRTAVIIPVYNKANQADNLVKHILTYVKQPVKFFVLDNGGDRTPYYATHRVEKNLGTGGGILYALDLARNSSKFDFYWFLSTSLSFVPGGDPLDLLMQTMSENDAVAVGPGWIGEIYSWAHRFMRATGQDRETKFINTCGGVLWDAAWFDSVGRFNAGLTTGWGSDYELSYKARQAGRKMMISGAVEMTITEGATYPTQEAYQEYQQRATGEMNSVLSSAYGGNWRDVLMEGVNAS